MKKQPSALWNILFFCIIINITACNKIEISKPEFNKTIDETLILIESYKFKMVHDDVIKQIIEVDQAIKLEGLDGFDFNNVIQYENLGRYLSNANSKADILLAYNLGGITNGVKIFSLIEKKMDLFKNLTHKYDSLQLLGSNDVKLIIKYAFKYTLKNHLQSSKKSMVLEDNCVKAYKNGIADCDEDYQSALTDSFATTAFLLFTGGPLSSLANFTYTAFKAVTNYNSCNYRVIRNFKSCINEINNVS